VCARAHTQREKSYGSPKKISKNIIFTEKCFRQKL